jgi:hypothetical protein
VHNEIKRLPYKNLKVLQLASRDKLCINEDIDKEDYSGKLLSQKCMEVTSLVRNARLHSYHQRTIENDARIEIPDHLREATQQLRDVTRDNLRREKPCMYYSNGRVAGDDERMIKWDVVDIEDLVREG